jgi:hypothetical protein
MMCIHCGETLVNNDDATTHAGKCPIMTGDFSPPEEDVDKAKFSDFRARLGKRAVYPTGKELYIARDAWESAVDYMRKKYVGPKLPSNTCVKCGLVGSVEEILNHKCEA